MSTPVRLDAAARIRRFLQEVKDSGWDMQASLSGPDVGTGGRRIYLCHLEREFLFLGQVLPGSWDEVMRRAASEGLTFEMFCDVLTDLLVEASAIRGALPPALAQPLMSGAIGYLAGTRCFELARASSPPMPQFVVILHRDVGNGGHILRPIALTGTRVLSPDDVVQVVLDTLAIDQQRHPERFRRGQVIQFRPRQFHT